MNDFFGGITNSIGGLLVALALLSILVLLAGIVLILGLFFILIRRLVTVSSNDGPAVSLFGAPATPKWFEAYQRWLFKLEDITRINFSMSPERLAAGTLVLAVVGGSLIAVLMEQILSIPFLLTFAVVTVINGLSAWWLSKPAANWWQGIPDGQYTNSFSNRGGFNLGNPLDED